MSHQRPRAERRDSPRTIHRVEAAFWVEDAPDTYEATGAFIGAVVDRMDRQASTYKWEDQKCLSKPR